MKNFLSKTKGNYPHSSKWGDIRTQAVVIIVAFTLLFFAKSIVSTIGSLITTPIFFVRHYIETSSATVPVFIRGRMELQHEIDALKETIQQGSDTEATLAYLTRENKELRALMHESEEESILAGVILRPPFSPYDTLVIDKGTQDGIVELAPVYFGDTIAIGYVRAVYDGHAYVTLFSSPDVETSVYVFGPDIFTTAYGMGGGVVRLSVPQGIMLALGDTVILPSLDTGVLGVIADIQSIPTEPEQHAYVTFKAPIQSIRLVRIGMKPVSKANFDEVLQEVDEMKKQLFTVEVPQDFQITQGTSTEITTKTQASTSTLP